MRRGRNSLNLKLGSEQQEQLESVSASTSIPHGLVMRARMILACAEGLSNVAVAAKVGASPQAVGRWRRRFLERGVEGLHDELRPGRPRTYDDEKVAAVINRALQQKPDEATHWSVRLMASEEGCRRARCSAGSRFSGSSRTCRRPSSCPRIRSCFAPGVRVGELPHHAHSLTPVSGDTGGGRRRLVPMRSLAAQCLTIRMHW